MGSVHLAADLVRGETVALKLSAESSAAALAGLRKEYELLDGLRHPHLPEAHDWGRDPASGRCWFTMELVAGPGLDRALEELGSEAAVDLLLQACRALAFLHSRGFVHGDLKPANLLVCDLHGPRPRLKLIDLGLSGRIGSGPRGLIRGTPRYAARSVLEGEPPTRRSDLFALGASFLEALTGRTEPPAADDARAARLQPELARILERLVADDEDTRYQSAEHAVRDLDPLASRRERAVVPTEPSFVGREDELALLEGELRRLGGGEPLPRVCVLTGEGGIGKSRLLREVGRRAALNGVLACRAQGQRDESEAWRPMREVLRHLRLVFEEEDPQLAAQIEELSGRLGPAAPVEPESTSSVLGGSLRATLEAVARRTPLLVLLDDLQGCDEATLGFLDQLAWSGAEAPLWFLCAGRDAEPTSAAPLRALLAGRGCRRIELGALAYEHTRRLVTSMLSLSGGAPALAERIAELTDGNPHFAESAARAVAESWSGSEEAELEEIVHRGLPTTLAEALSKRVEALETEERTLASELSILTRPVSPEFLRAYASASGEELDILLEGLLGKAILERGFSRDQTLAFRSDTLRRLFLARLHEERRRELHRRAARAWLAGGSDPRSLAAVLSEHHLAAGDASAALEPGLLAARLSLASRAPGPAVSLCRRLLEAGAATSRASRGRLLELLGDAHQKAGDATRALDCLDRALDLFPAPRAQLQRKRALAREELGDHQGARHAVLEALELCPGGSDPEERAQALGLLARICFAQGEVEEASALLHEGLGALADPARHPAAAQLWNNLGVIASEQSAYELSRTYHRKALAIRVRHGDQEGRSRSLTNLGNLALIAGDLADALRFYEEALALKRRFGNRASMARSLSNLALLESRLGSYGPAIERHEEALAHREEIGDAAGQIQSHRHLAELWHEKGELERALVHAGAAVSRARETGAQERSLCGPLLIEATVEASLGRAERATTLAEEGLEIAVRIRCGSDEALARTLLAQVALARDPRSREAARDLSHALELLREAREPHRLAHCLLIEGRRCLDLGALEDAQGVLEEAQELALRLEDVQLVTWTEHLLGRLALLGGQRGEAAERLHAALEQASRLGLRELEWQVCASLATLHEGDGRRERALIWLRRCLRIFQSSCERLQQEGLDRAYLAEPERVAVLGKLEALLG
jgi:tetratricopeptide (TPR) repeat protein